MFHIKIQFLFIFGAKITIFLAWSYGEGGGGTRDEEEKLCMIMYSSYGGNICSGSNKKNIFSLAFTFAA